MMALWIAVEQIRALWFKLQSFVALIAGPVDVFYDNEAVTMAVRQLESTLSKKHTAVSYHKVCESMAMDMI